MTLLDSISAGPLSLKDCAIVVPHLAVSAASSALDLVILVRSTGLDSVRQHVGPAALVNPELQRVAEKPSLLAYDSIQASKLPMAKKVYRLVGM